MEMIILTMSNLLVYSLLLLILFVSISLFRFIVKKRSVPKRSIRHPPSPPALPIIGHLHLLGSVFPKSLQTLGTRYGPLMRLRIASASVVVVSDAATANEMLKHNELNFLSRPHPETSSYSIYDGTSFVFAEYGTYWRFMKKICMSELLSVAQVNRFADIRREELMQFMQTLMDCSNAGKPCDLGALLMTMTNNLICKMVMSTRCSGNADESKLVRKFVHEIQDISINSLIGKLMGPLGKLDVFGFGRRLKAVLNEFDSFIEGIMAEHEKNNINIGEEKGRKDVMDILLDIYIDEKAEVKLTRTHIKSFLLELFLAGTDTTSVALQWAMTEVINDPRTFKKLREEIDSVVGSDRMVEESDVPNLPYLQAIVKESLRMHASAPLTFRRSEEDCKINGYDILANERILFILKAIMRDPNSWENPDDFVPERFKAKTSKENYDHHYMEMRGQNFSIMPLGSGRRGCPGASLALTVIHAAIGMLVQCFDFKVGDGEVINMEEGPGFATPMAYPFVCYPIMRLNPSKLVHV